MYRYQIWEKEEEEEEGRRKRRNGKEKEDDVSMTTLHEYRVGKQKKRG